VIYRRVSNPAPISLKTRIGLLTGQSVPIFRCGRKRRFIVDRHVLNDQSSYASDQNSDFNWARFRAAYHGFIYPVAQFVNSVAVLPCRNPRVGHRDHRWKANMNTLAQAGVRRNRLKNNTTCRSPAPAQAICNCWHKRTLAGYPTVLAIQELRPSRSVICRSYAGSTTRVRRTDKPRPLSHEAAIHQRGGASLPNP
jgi:hypothetical protein